MGRYYSNDSIIEQAKGITALREQVERLTNERDIKEHCIVQFESEHLLLKEQLAALAEQNEKMREALQAMVDEAFARNCGLKIADDALALPDLTSPVLNRIKESNDDVLVMDALRSGEWRITKSIPCECLTDEANAKSAWCVERMCAPFCDDKNLRSWFGRTPIEALSNGKDAIRARAAELENEDAN